MTPPPPPTIDSIEVEDLLMAAVLSISVPATATSLSVWRVSPSGTIAGVRGWYPRVGVTGGAVAVVRDYEAPLGIPLTYFATAENVDGEGDPSAGVEFEIDAMPIENPMLCDLVRPQNHFEIVIESLPQLDYAPRSGVHRIAGRRDPVVTSDVAGTPEFELTFATFNFPGGPDAVQNALGSGNPVLLRTPPEQGPGNLYFSVLGWTEERISAISLYPERRYVVKGVQVMRPDPSIFVPIGAQTYETLLSERVTYDGVKTFYPNYDAALYDYALASAAPAFPWPPRDI